MSESRTFRMTRGSFLAKTAVTAGALAVGSKLVKTYTVEAAPSAATTNLTIMFPGATSQGPTQVDPFVKLNPDIKVTVVEHNAAILSSMLVAGNPPDYVWSQGAPEQPYYLARGLATDLTPYLAKSKVLLPSTFGPINDLYRWNGKREGSGPYYGLATDYSQDAMLWYDKDVFAAAKVAIPSDTTVLTYDEMLALAQKLTVRKNGKIVVYGLDVEWGWETQAHLMQMLAQNGQSLFNADLSAIDLTTPVARKALQWYVDYAQAHVGPSPLDPEPNWDGSLMPIKRLGLALYGYWFNNVVNVPDPNSKTGALIANVGLLPAPQFGPKRVSACFAGSGGWIPATAQHKDAAFRYMEWNMGPSMETMRASTGRGLPAFKQYQSLLPHTKPTDAQVYRVQMNELKYFSLFKFSPYITDAAFEAAFAQYMVPVLHGQSTVDVAAQQLTGAVNLLLQAGKQAISG